MTAARTMFEKIWQRHVVVDRPTATRCSMSTVT